MIIAVDSKNPFAETAFGGLGTVRVLSTRDMRPENIRDADAIIVRSETKVDRALLSGTSVRFVGTATIGVDHVDVSYLRDNGIAFAYAPGCNANSVAEYVMSALMVLAIRNNRPLGTMSLGVVGKGNVGTKVASMAAVFGMSVVCNDPPRERTGDPGPFVGIDRVLSCDVVTLHVPLTNEGQDKTIHLFGAERLARMKKGSILINTSRGPVVDGIALLKSLNSGHIGGAVLDVWEGEPDIDASLLERAHIGTPHIAGYSFDGKLNAVRMMAEALRVHLKKEWSGGEAMAPPPPKSSILEAPRTHTPSLEQGVLAVTTCCYDIMRDDEALRALLTMPLEERPPCFRRLRSEYPVRREFNNYSVRISPDEIRMRSILSGIGFTLAQPDIRPTS